MKNNITLENIMIFKNEKDGKVRYKGGFSKKELDNQYSSAYIDIRFPKEAVIQDRTKYNIKGFLTYWLNNDKKPQWYIVVTDYSSETKVEQSKSIKQDDIEINDNDLPF